MGIKLQARQPSPSGMTTQKSISNAIEGHWLLSDGARTHRMYRAIPGHPC